MHGTSAAHLPACPTHFAAARQSQLCATSHVVRHAAKKQRLSPAPRQPPAHPWPLAASSSDAVGVAAAAAENADEELPGCVVGIDLGTSNSVVALIEGGEPVAVPSAGGAGPILPSVVAFRPDGEVLVGQAAKRQAAVNPRNTFYSVKRFIGRPLKEAEADAARVAYSMAADEEGTAVMECDASESGVVYPEEVSSCVLGQLLEDASAYAGRPVTKAVISVPAYFNDAQREATAAAGRLAGLESIKIIREPVAAALAYGLDAEEDQTVLVFDLGGGTYDVSLLEVGGGVIEVLSTGGDAALGGDDWDAAIVDWLVAEHLRPSGVDAGNPRIRANLKAVAEAAKMRLSEEERVIIRMPLAGGIEAVLTRQMFEGMTADLFRRARAPLDQACWQAGVDLGTAVREYEEAVRSLSSQRHKQKRQKQKGGGSGGGGKASSPRGLAAAEIAASGPQIRPKRRMPVGAVLLVGGATRMPAVRRFVKNMTGLEPADFAVDPDLAVALGAAVQAGIYEGQVSDLMVMDVWQAALMRAYAQQIEKERRAEERAAARAAGGGAAADEEGDGEDGESEGEGEDSWDGEVVEEGEQ